MLHLYLVSTGELISSATVIDIIPAGMAVKDSNKKGTWNTSALDFDPVVVDRVLSKDDYLDLFTDDEIVAIITTSNTDANIKTSLDILNYRGRIRMNSKNSINSINYMASIGLITPARAAEILNG